VDEGHVSTQTFLCADSTKSPMLSSCVAAASFYTVVTGTLLVPTNVRFVTPGLSYGPSITQLSPTQFQLSRGTYLLQYQVCVNGPGTLTVVQDGVAITSSAVPQASAGTIHGSQVVISGGASVVSIVATFPSSPPNYINGSVAKLDILQLSMSSE
jgi:hypothetical protein